MNNKKMLQPDGFCGNLPRIYYSKRYQRHLIKCGCCDESFEVWDGGEYIEINGVLMTKSYARILFEQLTKDKQRRK